MFLPGAFSMRVVVLFAAAVAVAVLAAALAAKLMPDAARLAYGEPMPYLKVAREGDVLKIWLEDYAGLKPRRVWLYVNGQLKAVNGPAYARCGDRVAALAQYETGVRRVEAEVRCTKPAKAPESVKVPIPDGEVRKQYMQAFSALAQNALGVPYKIEAVCERVSSFENYAKISIRITTKANYVMCAKTVWIFSWGLIRFSQETPGYLCGNPVTMRYHIGGGNGYGFARVFYSFFLYKHVEAPAAQFAGAGGFNATVLFNVWSQLRTYMAVDVYVDGTLIASCSEGAPRYLSTVENVIDVEGILNALAQGAGYTTKHVTLFQLSGGRTAGYSTENLNFERLATYLYNNQMNVVTVIFECVETDPSCRPWLFSVTGYNDWNALNKALNYLVRRPWIDLLKKIGWIGSLESQQQTSGGGYSPPSRYFYYNTAGGTVSVLSPTAFGAVFANAIMTVDAPPRNFILNATSAPPTAVFWT